MRGLIDLADKIATRLSAGIPSDRVADQVFANRDGADYSSPMAQEKSGSPRNTMEMKRPPGKVKNLETLLKQSFTLHRGNISAVERDLHAAGHNLSRRKITKLVKALDLKPPD